MPVSSPDLYPKGRSNTGGKLSKTGRFLVETKRNKHILAGYNVCCLPPSPELHRHYHMITQTRGSFNDHLLNDSLAVQ